jgi:hypothetical protein
LPRISEFFGIVISMYHSEHGPPHFHARYGEQEGVLSVGGALLRGGLSPRVLRLVREWSRIHRGALLRNWNRARRCRALERIPPLE